MLRVVPYAAVHFAAYEQFRTLLARQVYGVDATGRQMPPTLDLLAGSAAGGTAVLLTYPLDLVRTKLAYDSEAGRSISDQDCPVSMHLCFSVCPGQRLPRNHF